MTFQKIKLILILLFFSSCSSYIQRVHQQMDREYQQQRPANLPTQQLTRGIQQSRGQQALTSQDSNFQAPRVQRQYSNSRMVAQSENRRVQARDFQDNSSSSSLWSSSDRQLFAQTRSKQTGDIVLINVMDKLKNEISLELRRAFPPPRRQQHDQEQGEASREPTSDPPPDESGGNQIHDRISSVIVEQISNDHFLIRGRKNVLYRNARRQIEIQAMISRRDISDNDTISSDDIIESQITVMR